MLHSRNLRISFAQLRKRVSAKQAGVHSICCHYSINIILHHVWNLTLTLVQGQRCRRQSAHPEKGIFVHMFQTCLEDQVKIILKNGILEMY